MSSNVQFFVDMGYINIGISVYLRYLPLLRDQSSLCSLATTGVVTLQQTDTAAIIHSVSRSPAGTKPKEHIRRRTGAHVIRRPQGGAVKEQRNVRVTDGMLVTSRRIRLIVKRQMFSA